MVKIECRKRLVNGIVHAKYSTQGKCSMYIYSIASCGPRVLLALSCDKEPNTQQSTVVSALLPVVYQVEIRAKLGCRKLTDL